jgi:hypothetical protein
LLLAIMCSVKPEGIPQLCRTDEIGELCVCAVATGTSYYGLSGMTKNTFEVGRQRVLSCELFCLHTATTRCMEADKEP